MQVMRAAGGLDDSWRCQGNVDLSQELWNNRGRPKNVMQICKAHLDKFTPSSLATAWWVIAHAPKRGAYFNEKGFIQALKERTQATCDFSKRDFANLFWSLGEISIGDSKLVGFLVEKVKGQCCRMSAQELSKTAWGAKKLGVWDGEFWSAVAFGSESIIDQFSPQELIVFASSYPDDCLKREIMTMIAHEVMSKIGSFDVNNLIFLPLKVVRENKDQKAIIRAIDDRAVELFPSMQGPEIERLTKALCRLGLADSSFRNL